jgi:tetratricopeptide (TPR) repeat protein
MIDPRAHAATTQVGATATGNRIPGTTIRFFISSTFVDFQTERNVLQKRVFPELRKLCAASGFRLQPIDLRWGVSEAAGSERQTLRICFDELERCRQLSPDFFLLILLGDRYGSWLLPPTIPLEVSSLMQPHLSEDEHAAFATTYRLDENAVPAEYILLAAEGPARGGDEQLRQALLRATQAARLAEGLQLPFAGSATHLEIQRGLLSSLPDPVADAGVLCALRVFSSAPAGVGIEQFGVEDADRAERAQRLREEVLRRLDVSQVLRYMVAWEGAQPTFDPDGLAAAYLGLLQPKLEAVMAARIAARTALHAHGRDTVAVANSAFESGLSSQVVGRDQELARLSSYLANASGASVPLVVTGAAGSGKSTLLAEAANRAAAALPDAVVITRYIGVTPGTTSLVELLNDLRGAVAQAYNQPQPIKLLDPEELVSAVAAQLATITVSPEHPLLVVLDALDQLGTQSQRIDWLPRNLAAHVRVIVSVLDERFELSLLRAQLPSEQVVTLAPLGLESGRAMLRGLLAAAPPRTLNTDQEQTMLAKFTVQGLPLYLRLAAGEARRWRSFDPPQVERTPLPETIPLLLEAILMRMEVPAWLGRVLVGHTLGNLAAARFGLSEDELLDLLSRDEAVRAEIHNLSPYSPQIDEMLPLPVALWARLSAQIEPLLAEHEADEGTRLFTYYHQQLRAAVELHYLAGPAENERHQALADYFAGQPWKLSPMQWNWRKIRELVSQQESAGSRGSAQHTLTELAALLERTLVEPAKDETADYLGIDAVVDALEHHLTIGSYWRVAQQLYPIQAMALLAIGNLPKLGATFDDLGVLAVELGDREKASYYYEQALAVEQRVGNRTGEAITLNNLGTLANRTGRPEEAASYYERALAIHRELNDRYGLAMILNSLGMLATRTGQPEKASGIYQQALAIQREIGDRAGEATTLNNLGGLAHAQGRIEEADSYYQQALAIRREMGDRAGEANSLNNLAGLARDQGQLETPSRDLEQVLEVVREIGDRAGEATILNNLGELARAQGRAEEAGNYFQQSLSILREVGNRVEEGRTLNNLGLLAAELGDREEASSYYQQALGILREVRDQAAEANTLNNLGVLTAELGDSHQAINYFERALAIQRNVGDQAGEATTLNNLGGLTAQQGSWEEATHYLEKAHAIMGEVGDPARAAMIMRDLGELARAHGHKTDALGYYERALTALREVGDRAAVEDTLSSMVELAVELGRPEDLIRYLQQALAIVHESEDRESEGELLIGLGTVAAELGRPDQTVEYYEQALAIWRELGKQQDEAMTLGNLGELAAQLGRPDQALAYHKQELAILRETGNRAHEAATLNRLGRLAATQGQYAEATSYYKQALAISQEVEDPAHEAATLNNLGVLADDQGRTTEARSYYERALTIARDVGDKEGEATGLTNLAQLAATQRQYAEARSYYEHLLAIERELGDRAGEGTALNQLGYLAGSESHDEEARSYYEQALAIFQEVGDRAGEATTLGNLGALVADQGRLTEVESYLTQAVAIFEAIGAHDDAEELREVLEPVTIQRPRRRRWPFGRRV